ncbi:MAG: antitoxin [Actinomycetota bacterium]|nr:antitoxin [Actinomycetota bacterium]
MTATTIKVSRETRDRLKAQAARSDITLGEHLARLADRADRDLRFQALRESIARTSEADMRSYEAETREWLDADLGV